MSEYFKYKKVKWNIFPINNQMCVYRYFRHYEKNITCMDIENDMLTMDYIEFLEKYFIMPPPEM